MAIHTRSVGKLVLEHMMKKGTKTRKPLTAKERHHIEELVACGMHISEARFVIAIERGDSIGDVVTTPEELANALGKSSRSFANNGPHTL